MVTTTQENVFKPVPLVTLPLLMPPPIFACPSVLLITMLIIIQDHALRLSTAAILPLAILSLRPAWRLLTAHMDFSLMLVKDYVW